MYIKNYINGKGMIKRHKIIVITFLWITISISALIYVEILWIKILLFIIAIGVSIHILKIKTCNNANFRSSNDYSFKGSLLDKLEKQSNKKDNSSKADK